MQVNERTGLAYWAAESLGWVRVIGNTTIILVLVFMLTYVAVEGPPTFKIFKENDISRNKLLRYELARVEQEQANEKIAKKAQKTTPPDLMGANFEGNEDKLLKSMSGTWVITSTNRDFEEIDIESNKFSMVAKNKDIKGTWILDDSGGGKLQLILGGKKEPVEVYDIIMISQDFDRLVLQRKKNKSMEIWDKKKKRTKGAEK